MIRTSKNIGAKEIEAIIRRHGKQATRFVEILVEVERSYGQDDELDNGEILERYAGISQREGDITLALLYAFLKLKNKDGSEIKTEDMIYDAMMLGAVTGYKLAQKRFTQ